MGVNANIGPANTPLNPTADPYPKFKTETFNMFGGINAKVSSYINSNSPQQFRDILNLNFLFPGALNKRPGSTLYGGVTVSGGILGGWEYQKQDGSSYIIFGANTNLYSVTPSNVTPVVTNLKNGAYFDFITMVDRLFCCNGDSFFKFDGVNNYKYSLPPGATAAWGISAALGGSMLAGFTGTFVCAYGYVNERGYGGPVSNGFTVVLDGVTFNSITYAGMTQPFSGYGVTALQLWRTSNGGVNFFGTTLAVSGATQVTDTGFPLGTSLAIPHLWFTMAPRFVELYNNQLFLGGFSQFPSRLYWSEIGEPEAIQPNYFAEFRTNDGDRLSGVKPYGGAMVVGKQRSLHRMVGDNPGNFALQEITTEYGSLSQQSMVVFENLFWCLDQKGVVQYDGANVGIISDAVEPFFIGANTSAAMDSAVGAHYKQTSEVWFAFPFTGSTLAQMILAYDYIVKAWTRYDNIAPTSFFIAQGNQGLKTLFYGGYTGGLFAMGQSYMSDNGVAFTCSVFTDWLAANGQTSENLYRRLWLDVDPILGVTQTIGVKLYTNYATTTVGYTGVLALTAYQNRLDFGIPARTMAAHVAYSSATLPFKLNAYTFESRYLRST